MSPRQKVGAECGTQVTVHDVCVCVCECVCACDVFDRKCIQFRFHVLRNLIGRFKLPYGRRTQNVLNRKIKVSTFSEAGWVGGGGGGGGGGLEHSPPYYDAVSHAHTHTLYNTTVRAPLCRPEGLYANYNVFRQQTSTTSLYHHTRTQTAISQFHKPSDIIHLCHLRPSPAPYKRTWNSLQSLCSQVFFHLQRRLPTTGHIQCPYCAVQTTPT